MIARCEFVIRHAKRDAIKLREEAEKAELLLAKEIEAKSNKLIKSTNTKINQQVTDNEFMCDHCEEEFENEKLHKEHTHSCQICKVTFNEYPDCLKNHIIYNHEELYCENCGKYFTTQTKISKHNKKCIRYKKCQKYF